MIRSTLKYCGLLALSLLLLSCSHRPETTVRVPDTAPVKNFFPPPAGLEPQINFWRNVYANWSQSQVVLHDDRHLDLIYEIIELPGLVGDRYTKAHRAHVRSRQKALETQLRQLEKKWTAAEPLLRNEQQLLQRIVDIAGEPAIKGAADRLRSQRGLKERFKEGLTLSGRYLPAFRQIFSSAGLPEDLAFLPHVESSFRTMARSSAGALGMWQFTRGAAKEFMMLNEAVDERLDPFASARGAARYLNFAHDLLDDWALSVTSYNHGIGSMRQAKKRFGTDFMRIVREYDRRSFGFASRNFYAEFLAAREIALTPERFFPEGIQYQAQQYRDRVILLKDIGINDLSMRYRVDKAMLSALNPAWKPAAVNGHTTLPRGHEVWLPAGAVAAYIARVQKLTGPELALLFRSFPHTNQ